MTHTHPRYLLLREPSANRVYTASAGALAAAELALLCPAVDRASVEEVSVAGVPYLSFALLPSGAASDLALLGPMSCLFAMFSVVDRLDGTDGADGLVLTPVEVPRPDVLDDDLVSIPKYPGKTNEQLTRLLVNLTLSVVSRPEGPRRVLDPMCGRGTTLTTALTLGHDAVGVEQDDKALEAAATFLRTYLRRKRLKHTADVTPVRREGRRIGRRLDVTVTPTSGRPLSLTVLGGDARRSAELCGKRRFDAVVLDAPYGVVHGSHAPGSPGGSGSPGSTSRDRSPRALLAQALPVWAGQLHPGGALGLAWNTLGLPRDVLVAMVRDAGLLPLDTGPWRTLTHRVDSSIVRDVLVAVRPGPQL